MSVPLSPSQLDYICYLLDECDLTVWEKGFCESTQTWLRKQICNKLSSKQAYCLQRMIDAYHLKDDIKQGYLYPGFSARTNEEVMNDVGPGTGAKFSDSIDDLDDDVPF